MQWFFYFFFCKFQIYSDSKINSIHFLFRTDFIKIYCWKLEQHIQHCLTSDQKPLHINFLYIVCFVTLQIKQYGQFVPNHSKHFDQHSKNPKKCQVQHANLSSLLKIPDTTIFMSVDNVRLMVPHQAVHSSHFIDHQGQGTTGHRRINTSICPQYYLNSGVTSLHKPTNTTQDKQIINYIAAPRYWSVLSLRNTYHLIWYK